MDKTLLIKNIIGKKIDGLGFKYLKKDSQSWIFYREVTGIKRYYEPEKDIVGQYLMIQEHRYTPALTVRVTVDIYGKESYNLLNEIFIQQWLDYVDEKSFCERLELIADLMSKEGIELLDEISVEDAIIPTKRMAEQLFLSHKELDESFVEEFDLDVKSINKENIDKWFKLINELIKKSQEKNYDDVKEMLLKISAFVGERACEMLSLKWNFPPHFKVPSLVGGNPYHSFFVLSIIVDIWKGDIQSLKMLEEEFCIMKKTVN